MSQGWVATHRKLKESSFYKDSQAVHLWIHLLISANHRDAQVVRGNKVYEVKRGQLLTGRKLLSSETGINESKLQRLLKVFEKCHMIEQQTNNVNRLISILNYDEYQTSEQQVNNKRTASEQQVNTNNNDNNDNNNRNIIGDQSPKKKTIQEKKEDFKKEVSDKWTELGGEAYLPHSEMEAFFSYWSETKMKGRQMKCEKQETFEVGNRLGTWRKKFNERRPFHDPLKTANHGLSLNEQAF